MRRPQFSLRTLLTAMLVIAAFLGGTALQRRLDQPTWIEKYTGSYGKGNSIIIEKIELRDGSRWYRAVDSGSSDED